MMKYISLLILLLSFSFPLFSTEKVNILGVEMESAALYMNAARLGKNALCILTVSDCPLRGLSTTPEERQTTFTDMMEIALEAAVTAE